MLENLLTRPPSTDGGGLVKPFQYFRMFITARNESAAITVGEWEILDGSGVNRALGKPATASDQGFGNASAAFDGIVPATLAQPRWQTNSATNPQWLQVNIGSQIQAKQFVLYCDTSSIPNFANYSAQNWKFQGSNNGVDWEDILSVSGWTVAVWKTKRKHVWNADGSPVT